MLAGADEPLDPQFVAEFKALFDDPQPLDIQISKFQAWCLMAAVQLAAKHPQAMEYSAMVEACAIARVLQGTIAKTPRLISVAKKGWGDSGTH